MVGEKGFAEVAEQDHSTHYYGANCLSLSTTRSQKTTSLIELFLNLLANVFNLCAQEVIGLTQQPQPSYLYDTAYLLS